MHSQAPAYDAPMPIHEPLSLQHPVVIWVVREVVPLLLERLQPRRVVVFDPPDRPASVGNHALGIVIVSESFRAVPMTERLAVVHALLAGTSPVRPFCLTPSEYAAIETAPGPLLGAIKLGVIVL
ncbi:MAG: hypothetical protein U0V87_12005 [Acidobacteriota bacterium]